MLSWSISFNQRSNAKKSGIWFKNTAIQSTITLLPFVAWRSTGIQCMPKFCVVLTWNWFVLKYLYWFDAEISLSYNIRPQHWSSCRQVLQWLARCSCYTRWFSSILRAHFKTLILSGQKYQGCKSGLKTEYISRIHWLGTIRSLVLLSVFHWHWWILVLMLSPSFASIDLPIILWTHIKMGQLYSSTCKNLLEHLYDTYTENGHPMDAKAPAGTDAMKSIVLQAIQNMTPADLRAVVMEIESFFNGMYPCLDGDALKWWKVHMTHLYLC